MPIAFSLPDEKIFDEYTMQFTDDISIIMVIQRAYA